jgi:hypothetical protein
MTDYTDPETVKFVQMALKEKGYVDVNEVDGKLGGTTMDVILAFRRRNNLPLVPVIDGELMDVLETAPNKELPARVVNVEVEEVKDKVAAAATVAKSQVQSWWAKFWAWAVGLPSFVLALLQAIIANFGDAVNSLQPVRNFLSEVPVSVWLVGFGLVALVLGIQAMRSERLAKEAQKQMVEGYQKGTVKNDADVGLVPPTGAPTAVEQEKENQDAKLS